jgi:hypothetical protein
MFFLIQYVYPRFQIWVMQIGTSFRIRLFQVIWIRIHNINFNQHKETFFKLHFKYNFYKDFFFGPTFRFNNCSGYGSSQSFQSGESFESWSSINFGARSGQSFVCGSSQSFASDWSFRSVLGFESGSGQSFRYGLGFESGSGESVGSLLIRIHDTVIATWKTWTLSRMYCIPRMVVREMVTFGEWSHFSCSEDWSFGEWSFGEWTVYLLIIYLDV